MTIKRTSFLLSRGLAALLLLGLESRSDAECPAPLESCPGNPNECVNDVGCCLASRAKAQGSCGTILCDSCTGSLDQSLLERLVRDTAARNLEQQGQQGPPFDPGQALQALGQLPGMLGGGGGAPGGPGEQVAGLQPPPLEFPAKPNPIEPCRSSGKSEEECAKSVASPLPTPARPGRAAAQNQPSGRPEASGVAAPASVGGAGANAVGALASVDFPSTNSPLFNLQQTPNARAPGATTRGPRLRPFDGNNFQLRGAKWRRGGRTRSRR